MLVGYIIYLKVKKGPILKNEKFRQNAFVLFIIISFFLQPFVLQACLQMFKYFVQYPILIHHLDVET